MSRGRAFGKVIVLGEHAVVYGQPALASALAQGCTVTVTPNDVGHSRLRLNQDVHAVDNAEHAVCRAVSLTLKAAGQRTPVDVHVEFDIPAGAGLGSSAALSVALPRAFSLDVKALSLQIEKVFHGNPSGLDALLAETGALGVFTRQDGLSALIPGAPMRVVIADTGVPRSTQTQVSNVAARKERLGAPVDRVIEAIGLLTLQGAEAAKRADWPRLGELMNTNHGLLSALGVSSPELEKLVAIARAAGAFGAKLTGAGGGGCIIALGNEEAVAAALAPHSKSVLVSTLGAQ